MNSPAPTTCSETSAAGPRPAGRTATAASWVAATGCGRTHTLADPELVERPWRDHAGAHAESPRKVQRFVAPEAHVVELPHASVWGQDGTVLTPDGCVVEDLTRAWGQAIEHHPVWAAASTPIHAVRGTAAVVAARGAATNFSHFLADTLPRIQLVRETGLDVDTWIVSATEHPWQRDAFDLAGLPRNKLVSLNDTPLVTADTLVVPSRTGFAPTTAPWARRRLIDLLRPQPRERRRRILVSRRHARRRRLRNEEALLEALARHGFEHVEFDTMPLDEQVKTIHESGTIVAVHGAALAHLLHAPTGGQVIEITHPDTIHPEYQGLAALSGWDHTTALAVPARDSPTTTDPILHDLVVDPATVVEALAQRLDAKPG